MRNQRRINYLRNRNEQLEVQIKALSQENKRLEKENEELHKTIDDKDSLVEKLEFEHKKLIQKYTDKLKEMRELNNKYKDAIRSIYVLKEGYRNEMSVLLQRIRNGK